MRTRAIAAIELALLFPAALFMTALALRNVSPQQFEPARAAQQLVMWYGGRMWTLWALLLALPFAALVTGCATLRHSWKRDMELLRARRQSLAIRAPLATLFVAAITVAAAGILAIVVLHMLAN